jgi:PAS domain S-box-containing protein
MPKLTTVRERRLCKTKAQLIDEIDSFERRVAALEVGRDRSASGGRQPPLRDDYLANQALLDLAKFPSENPNPVLRMTPEGGLLYANDAAQAVKGLLTGRKKDRLPRKLAKVASEVSRTATARQSEFHSGDRTLILALTPVAGESYINIYGRDITEGKRAEEALRESEQRFMSILKDSPIAVAAIRSSDREVIYANPRIYEMFRIDEQQLRTQGPNSYYADNADRERMAELLKSDGFVHDEETRLKRGDGTEFWATVSFMDIDYDGEPGRMAWFYDITERKRAEQELAAKEAQLRVALDSMPGGIMLGDRNLNYVLFNSQYCELFEFPDGLVRVGRSFRDEVRYQADRGDYGPGDKDDLIEQVVAIYQRGEPVSYEREIAGSGRTIQIYLAPTPEGGYVTIATDITERKQVERNLSEKEALLRLALDNMPGGLAVNDSDFNYVVVNNWIRDYFGVPDGLMEAGQPMEGPLRFLASQGVYGPGDTDDLVKERLEILKNPEATDEELTMPDGRILQLHRQPLEDGGRAVIFVDITERKRAEEALREAKRQSEEASELVAEKNRMLESLSNQLSKYLSPQVYASIFSGEQSVEIASKRKKLTVFFSDIADFTGTTDSLESEELTNLLNHYLTEMSKIALDYGATIDKYVGDAIIAFFGDPETRGVKEDARACVNMAIAMQRRMRELRSEWLDMGLERPFQLRIGINTGFCTVGNFGSEDRMDYTIIGNEVNLAARLESLAEVGGILMAHETHSLVKDTMLAEEGDTLTVKGFAKPVRTYAVVGLYDDLADQGRIIRRDQDGLALVIDRNKLTKKGKAEAIKALEEAAAQLKG